MLRRMSPRFRSPLVLLAVLTAALAASPAASAARWETDGPVFAMQQSQGTLFLGGRFTALYRRSAPAVLLATTADALSPPPLAFDASGRVTLAVSDGIGGYYVAGELETGGVPERLVHVRDDGTRDAGFLASGLTVAPTAMAVLGSTVYVAGRGLPLTAVDGQVGTATPLPVQADGEVSALAIAGRRLIVAGRFAQLGTVPRANLGAIDLSNGSVAPWSPSTDGAVAAVAVDAGDLIVGGSFGTIAGAARRNLARVSLETGAVAPGWLAGSADPVGALAVGDDRVYYAASASSGPNLLALDRAAGTATSFRLRVSGTLQTILPVGGQVYLGGSFRKVGGRARLNLAAVDQRTAALADWNPSPAGPVASLVSGSRGRLLAGGSFTKIGYVQRRNLAAVNAASGRPLAWSPSADRPVRALAVEGSQVYVGGDFRTLSGAPRPFLGAVTVSRGGATAWAPKVDGAVRAIAVFGPTVVVGGTFRRAGRLKRRGLAAFGGDGRPRAWNARLDGSVRTLQRFRGTVLAGGLFRTVAGVPRRNFAVVTLNGRAAVTPLHADTNGEVRAVAIDGGELIVGGDFTRVNGAVRRSLARVDQQSHVVPWGAPLAGRSVSVDAIGLAGASVYVGGSFDFAGGQRRPGVAAFARSNGVLQPWQVGFVVDPATTPSIAALSAGTASVVLGGAFTLTSGSANLVAVDPQAGAERGS